MSQPVTTNPPHFYWLEPVGNEDARVSGPRAWKCRLATSWPGLSASMADSNETFFQELSRVFLPHPATVFLQHPPLGLGQLVGTQPMHFIQHPVGLGIL